MSQHKFSMTKFSPVKWKTGRRRKDFYQKKRRQQTRFSKKVVFENTGEYVKGENTFKKDKKKRNMGKTDVQSRKRSKKENVQKTQEKTHKKGKIEKKKKTERRTNMQKHTNLWRCLTKRLKAFDNAEVSNTCFS